MKWFVPLFEGGNDSGRRESKGKKVVSFLYPLLGMFYDSILLKYPSVVFKYRSWFEHVKPDVIPDGTDIIQLKQWQICLMIQAQNKAEQSSNGN